MKKVKWIVAVAFGIMSVTAYAQTEAAPAKSHPKTERHHHKERAGKWQENLKEFETQLKLSPEQVSQWQALHDARKEERKVLKQNAALTKEDKKAHAKNMRQHHQAELQKILSPEQYTQYTAIRKQHKQDRKAHRQQQKQSGK